MGNKDGNERRPLFANRYDMRTKSKGGKQAVQCAARKAERMPAL